MQYERPHFTKHGVPVIPDAVEPQHFPVELKELLQLVEGGGCRVLLDLSSFGPAGKVRILWYSVWLIDHDSFTLKEILEANNMTQGNVMYSNG